LGSSVAEISLLTEKGPVLMLLLILGALATYQTRVYEFTHPIKSLRALPGGMAVSHTPPSILPPITVLPYFLAAAAAANNIELSLSIGSQSVLAWACKSWWMPMIWILFSLTIYIAAGLSQSIMKKTDRQTAYTEPRRGFPLMRPSDFPRESNRLGTTPVMAVLLQLLASILAFVQVVLGTLILSSLIFIGFHDTLKILARLISSALVCRVIAMFELARIRKPKEETERNDTTMDMVVRS